MSTTEAGTVAAAVAGVASCVAAACVAVVPACSTVPQAVGPRVGQTWLVGAVELAVLRASSVCWGKIGYSAPGSDRYGTCNFREGQRRG